MTRNNTSLAEDARLSWRAEMERRKQLDDAILAALLEIEACISTPGMGEIKGITKIKTLLSETPLPAPPSHAPPPTVHTPTSQPNAFLPASFPVIMPVFGKQDAEDLRRTLTAIIQCVRGLGGRVACVEDTSPNWSSHSFSEECEKLGGKVERLFGGDSPAPLPHSSHRRRPG